MGEQSKIAWTDSTLNFWSGCTKVSAGCANCYAETLSNRGLTDSNGKLTIGQWGKGAPRKLHESAFKLAAKLNRKPWVCDDCGETSGANVKCSKCNEVDTSRGYCHRRRIFSLSLGDWLDPEVPIEWLARMLDTIRQCDQVDWLLCTKRPELFDVRLSKVQQALCDDCEGEFFESEGDAELSVWLQRWQTGIEQPENIVVLASVENQDQADKRIPELLRIPAWRRGLSCEPLLGPVDLVYAGEMNPLHGGTPVGVKLDWVIIGGESGNKARPCNVEWVRSLKDQCKAADVPCFVKQLGANAHGVPFPKPAPVGSMNYKLTDKKGGDWNEWPSDLKVREFYRL